LIVVEYSRYRLKRRLLLYLVIVKINDRKAEVVITPDYLPIFQAVCFEAGFFQIRSDIWMLRLAEKLAEIDVLDRTIVKTQAQLVFPGLGD
jgi:hypothetical protein